MSNISSAITERFAKKIEDNFNTIDFYANKYSEEIVDDVIQDDDQLVLIFKDDVFITIGEYITQDIIGSLVIKQVKDDDIRKAEIMTPKSPTPIITVPMLGNEYFTVEKEDQIYKLVIKKKPPHFDPEMNMNTVLNHSVFPIFETNEKVINGVYITDIYAYLSPSILEPVYVGAVSNDASTVSHYTHRGEVNYVLSIMQDKKDDFALLEEDGIIITDNGEESASMWRVLDIHREGITMANIINMDVVCTKNAIALTDEYVTALPQETLVVSILEDNEIKFISGYKCHKLFANDIISSVLMIDELFKLYDNLENVTYVGKLINALSEMNDYEPHITETLGKVFSNTIHILKYGEDGKCGYHPINPDMIKQEFSTMRDAINDRIEEMEKE